MSQLLSALAYAHSVAGVIHKDLKPDNILLVAKPGLNSEQMLLEPVHAILADFGLAEIFLPAIPSESADLAGEAFEAPGRTANVTRRSSRVKGTPSHMSPEMFKGSFTEKCDIWSLGVVLFQVMTGELPYKGANLMMQVHVVCDPRRHPPWDLLTKYGWSVGARWFCQTVLTKDEALRPSATAASRNDWLLQAKETHFEGNPPSAPERTTLQQQQLRSHLMNMGCTVSHHS